MEDSQYRLPEGPIPVEIKNWADPIKPPYVKSTTLVTYIVLANSKGVQICDYEPKRFRMALIVVDQPVILTKVQPVSSPDTSTASIAPQGAHLPVTLIPYELNGPDAMWLNSVSGSTDTRVTVIKEYI